MICNNTLVFSLIRSNVQMSRVDRELIRPLLKSTGLIAVAIEVLSKREIITTGE